MVKPPRAQALQALEEKQEGGVAFILQTWHWFVTPQRQQVTVAALFNRRRWVSIAGATVVLGCQGMTLFSADSSGPMEAVNWILVPNVT